MSVTIEFFSAYPDEFLQEVDAWFNAETIEEENIRSDRIYTLFPHADFSFHLRWPEDLDALCKALSAEGSNLPLSGDALLVEELWSDEVSVWVDRVSPQFIDTIVHLKDEAVRQVLKRWLSYLPAADIAGAQFYSNGLHALSLLRNVARDAVASHKSVLLLRVW